MLLVFARVRIRLCVNRSGATSGVKNDLALIQFGGIQIKLVLKILENRSSIHALPNSLTTHVYVNFKAKGKIQKNEQYGEGI